MQVELEYDPQVTGHLGAKNISDTFQYLVDIFGRCDDPTVTKCLELSPDEKRWLRVQSNAAAAPKPTELVEGAVIVAFTGRLHARAIDAYLTRNALTCRAAGGVRAEALRAALLSA